MYELSLIKSFLTKENFQAYRSFVPDKEFPKELLPVMKSLDDWYTSNTVSPSLEDVENLTFARGIPDKDKEYLKTVFQTIPALGGEETVKTLLERFKTQRMLQDLSLHAFEASEGRRSLQDVTKTLEALASPASTGEVEYVTDDLEEVLHRTIHAPGLRWRLGSLNRALGSLRGGNFGFVFARPETGKTTFLSSEATWMAENLTPEQGPILWFNNEEDGSVVKQRQFQSALGTTVENLEQYTKQANEKYHAKIKGKLKLIDLSIQTKQETERIIDLEKPSLVIIDQIDKVQGFKADREDLAMGQIYIWARQIAKAKKIPIIGVCQADASGENQKWLYMTNVANAKTAKQAEADWILGIGKIHDPGFENIRFLHLSKNKLAGDKDTDRSNRHRQWEVVIKPEIGRYEDIV